MSTTLNPISNILAHTRPMKAEAKAEQGFVESGMGTARSCMEVAEDLTVKGGRNNNET